jgi:crooked neck
MDIAMIAKVKNKNPAAIQISAEQLLREASERQDKPQPAIESKIQDKEELVEYQLLKRKGFEDAVRRNRTAIGAWIKYATWEEKNNEFDRARSVYERGLEHEYRNHSLWMKYIEMEQRQKNVNRARNLFDRVVSILPRVDLFWYKYTYMEEVLGNPEGARSVFERWMAWSPSEEGWLAYVAFEKRYEEIDKARKVYRRFVGEKGDIKYWIRYARFEEELGEIPTARKVYEECTEKMGEMVDQNFFVSFAKFETRHGELERARVVYKYALQHLEASENLAKEFAKFEKMNGDTEEVEDVMARQKRIEYEKKVEFSQGYDVWFDYIRLEEGVGNPDRIREIYERAVANTPPLEEKRYWRRYVYLWIYYAVWEELDANVLIV